MQQMRRKLFGFYSLHGSDCFEIFAGEIVTLQEKVDSAGFACKQG